jgi:hypothetical protein
VQSNDSFKGFSKVDIKTLRITSLVTQKTADISRLVKRLEIYQSLFDPSMTGIVVVEDPTGLIYDLPLLGEEILHIEFKTANNKEFEKVFFVYKPEDIARKSSMQSQEFTLYFASKEHFRAITTVVDQGFKATISDIASAVLTDKLKTEQRCTVEETRGIETLIIPGWNLWDSLEFLRQRAVSKKYDSPFFFYEDLDGFNFTSVEHLINTKKSANDIVNIQADPFNITDKAGDKSTGTVFASQYENAENFRIITKADTAAFINGGGAYTRTTVFDILDKSAKDIDLNFDEFGTTKVRQPLDATYNSNHSSFLKGLLSDPITRYAVPYDSTNPSAFVDTISTRQVFNRHLGDIVVGFSLYGNSQLSVGDLCNIRVPRTSASSHEDTQLSGHYIIGRLKHSISDDSMYTHVEAYRFGHAEKTI